MNIGNETATDGQEKFILPYDLRIRGKILMPAAFLFLLNTCLDSSKFLFIHLPILCACLHYFQVGIGSYVVHYFSTLVTSILENFGLSEEMHNPVSNQSLRNCLVLFICPVHFLGRTTVVRIMCFFMYKSIFETE